MEISRYLGRPTWVEIDLSNLAFNVREFRQFLPDAVKLMAVVKADAYGHGAYEVAGIALEEGASMLGVASLEEGAVLRQKGIKAPILILGYTDPQQNLSLLKMQLTPTVFNWESAYSLSQQARDQGKRAAIHVKIDTGMGRLGLSDPRDILNFLEKVNVLPGIIVEGIYTHFATADERDKSFARHQLHLFNTVLSVCKERMIKIPLKHTANSAATMELPEAHLDMVRVGISLYGYYPSREVTKNKVKLLPVMSLKSRIIFLKKVSAGTSISYGRKYRALNDTTIATVPLGYGDGYNRLLSNSGFMLVKGQKAPIAGKVCMDHTMLDVGEIPFVKEGDEVVAYGRQGHGEINIDEVAGQLGTISYEVLCNIGNRVPKVYCRDGSVQSIKFS
ncbi:MAG: alanine racemase [Dethiobacter sp.]|jgi:alanine racemase|nr:MAG: alanine racemase [Dethiobacter sp.]